jgi:hypothetical protein
MGCFNQRFLAAFRFEKPNPYYFRGVAAASTRWPALHGLRPRQPHPAGTAWFHHANAFANRTAYAGRNAYTAQSCSGGSVNAIGLYAFNLAFGCFGQSSTILGPGLYAYDADFCTADINQGTAIQAVIPNGCIVPQEGTNNVQYKYNMP